MRLRYSIVALLIITLPLAIVILYFAESINSFFRSQNADQILLVILILVDGMGGILLPWVFHWNNDVCKRNKLLTVECIKKLELNPDGDDEHILIIVNANTLTTEVFNGRTQETFGDKPPYFEQMKEHLQNYPKLWKLVQDLPVLNRNAKQAREILVSKIEKELKNVTTPQKLTSTGQVGDDVISKLANKVCSDIMDSSTPIDYSAQQMGDQFGVLNLGGGLKLAIPSSDAKVLTDKMTELSKDSLYRKQLKAVKNDFDQVQRGKGEFIKERNAIVEEIEYSNYKNLKGTPWWKKLR